MSTFASQYLPPPAESTEIPVAGSMRMYGAAAYFAVLAYPGTTARDHAKRDRLIEAVTEWRRGHLVYRAGQQRTTAKRRAAAGSDWLQAARVMDQRQMFATLNRATRIIWRRRLFCAAVVRQLVIMEAMPLIGSVLAQRCGATAVTISGPRSLTQALLSVDHAHRSASPRVAWRDWRETLPVLHLAAAVFDDSVRKPADDERPEFMMRLISRTDHWLARAVERSEVQALQMTHLVTNYDASARIQLVAAK